MLRVCSRLCSFFCFRCRRVLASTLFPYTTLFRSLNLRDTTSDLQGGTFVVNGNTFNSSGDVRNSARSEDHTPELQSTANTVSCLPPDKKNPRKTETPTNTRSLTSSLPRTHTRTAT